MAIIEINWKPSRTELRVFGAGLCVFCTLIGGWLVFRNGEITAVAGMLFGVALLSLAVSAGIPQWLHPVYCVFMAVAYPVGWVMSHVLFWLVYHLVFTPMGLVFRWLGRDPLQRKFDPEAETYWEPHKPRDSVEDYFRQF